MMDHRPFIGRAVNNNIPRIAAHRALYNETQSDLGISGVCKSVNK